MAVHSLPRRDSLLKTFEVILEDDVRIPVRVYGQAQAPRLVMSHGNGLAIGGYQEYWSRLIPYFQIVIFDFRGHGQSDTGSLANHAWSQFRRDFEQVVDEIDRQLGKRPTFGAFHSLSSLVALRNTQLNGPRWQGLLLFDPPIMPPNDNPWQQAHVDEMLGIGARVAQRQHLFASPSELVQQYKGSSMLTRWTPLAYQYMAHAALRYQQSEQNWRLSCPPEYEAKIFCSNDDTALWENLPNLKGIDMPIKLLCADPNVPNAASAAFTTPIVADLGGFDYDFVPETTHFLQLEQPEICAQVTREFCERHL